MEPLIRWAPRALGVGVALFIATFSLDAFSHGLAPADAIIHFAVHLIPAAVLLAVVAAAWRHEWIGAVVFSALALLYGTMITGRLDWIAAVSGPLLLTGVLFMISWAYRMSRARRATPEG